MPLTPWRKVSKALGVRPVVSADIGLRTPMRVERYLFQARRQEIPALPNALLIVHLGGARVSGGRLHGRQSSYVPSFAVFLAAGCPSQWLLEGAVDAAGFYLPAALGDRLTRQVEVAAEGASEYQFSDSLVTAAALQIVEELRRGPDADAQFLDQLGRVLMRQTERVFAGRTGSRVSPTSTQLGRLKSTLTWIDRHLDAELSNAVLARQVGLGESHFRHVFAKAFGVSPNQYVRQRRLERERVGDEEVVVGNAVRRRETVGVAHVPLVGVVRNLVAGAGLDEAAVLGGVEQRVLQLSGQRRAERGSRVEDTHGERALPRLERPADAGVEVLLPSQAPDVVDSVIVMQVSGSLAPFVVPSSMRV